MCRSYWPETPVRAAPKPMSRPPVVVVVLNQTASVKVLGAWSR